MGKGPAPFILIKRDNVSTTFLNSIWPNGLRQYFEESGVENEDSGSGTTKVFRVSRQDWATVCKNLYTSVEYCMEVDNYADDLEGRRVCMYRIEAMPGAEDAKEPDPTLNSFELGQLNDPAV